jgi:lipid-A-disaccharide synthase
MAKFAHRRGIKVFYYISPQIWAWKKSRVKTIRKYVDRMFVILPFEKAFYKKYDVEVDFVGHPSLDAVSNEQKKLSTRETFNKTHGLDDRPIVALLPGSRKQEVSKMLEVMLSLSPDYSGFQFVIAGVSSLSASFYNSLICNPDVKLIFDSTHDLLDKAHAALVTSGTATLETALMNVPEVVCYKGGFFSYQIAKRLVHIKYISLVNLVMDRKVVEELIQAEMNPVRLMHEFDKILEDKNRKRIFEDYKGRLVYSRWLPQ